MTDNLRILIIVDPRVVSAPLLPKKFDSWATVYSYSMIQSFKQNGHEVEIENVYDIINGEAPRLGEEKFDHALVILNNASKIFGIELFDNIRKKLLPGGLIGTMSDHDYGIEFEDVRFCATIINPKEVDKRAHQIFWGCDPGFLIPEKEKNTLTILLDSWHLEEKKYDRTPDLLGACLEYSEKSDEYVGGKKKIKILAWGETGIEEFLPGENEKLVRKPIRIGFEEMMRNLRAADIFVVTHSESMGLTILEAAMAGCVVVIPVPAKPNPDVTRWIKSDLAETIPHIEVPHRAEEKIELPWIEIEKMMNPNIIRNEVLGLTWHELSQRVIEGWKIREKGILNRDRRPPSGSLEEARTDISLRELMLITIEMIGFPENDVVREKFCDKWGIDVQEI